MGRDDRPRGSAVLPGKGHGGSKRGGGALGLRGVRRLVLAEVKVVVCGLIGATLAFAAAAAWPRQGRDQQVTGIAIAADAPRQNPRPDLRPEKVPDRRNR